jgi:hypothetical protein
MSRETKAGLVVSCSFLCLVGVVLFSKLNEKQAGGTDSPDEKELAQLLEEPRPAPSGDSGAPPATAAGSTPAKAEGQEKTQKPGPVVPIDYREPEERGTTPPPNPPALAPTEPAAEEHKASPPPAGIGSGEPAPPEKTGPLLEKPPGKPEATSATGLSLPSKDSPPPDSEKSASGPVHNRSSEPTAGPPSAAVAKEGDKPSPWIPMTETVAPNQPGVKREMEIKSGDPANKVVSGILSPTKIGESSDKGGRDAKQSAAPVSLPAEPASLPAPQRGADANKAAAGGFLPLPTKERTSPENNTKPEAAPTGPALTDGHKPVFQISMPPPPAPDSAPKAQAVTPRPEKLSLEAVKPGTASPADSHLPGGAELQEKASILMPMPASSSVGSAGKGVPAPSPATTTAPNPSAPGPPPSSPSSSLAADSPGRPPPPLGAAAQAASPRISIPAVPKSPQTPIGGNPQVESYDENTYTCKANDTFRTISQAVYHSDQYEHALKLFNRNHPLADSALQQDPPVLRAGLPVYIPPVRILEKYYGAPVLESPPRSPAPAPPPRATEHSAAAGSVPSPKLTQVSFGGPIKPLPPPDRMPLYRVREGGEMMYEVARRTLGSGDRWTEILRLNPRFDPKEVIPAGSQLMLPRDAHVSPQDVP